MEDSIIITRCGNGYLVEIPTREENSTFCPEEEEAIIEHARLVRETLENDIPSGVKKKTSQEKLEKTGLKLPIHHNMWVFTTFSSLLAFLKVKYE